MKLEHITLSGQHMHRLTLDGTTRTAAAAETLAAITEADRQERERHRQLEADRSAAHERVRQCVSHGADASQARAELARVQHALDAASERIDSLEAMAGEVRDSAIDHIAAQLREAHAAAMAAAAAALPPVPTQPEILK